MVPSQEPLFIQVNFLDLGLGREKIVRESDRCNGIITAKLYLKSNSDKTEENKARPSYETELENSF